MTIMNFQELSDRCRTPRTRAALSMALEASAAYNEEKKASIKEVSGIVAFARNNGENRKFQRRRIHEAVQRLMFDGEYSSLRGLSPRAQERGSYSPQSEASIEKFFCVGE